MQRIYVSNIKTTTTIPKKTATRTTTTTSEMILLLQHIMGLNYAFACNMLLCSVQTEQNVFVDF